MYVGVDSPNAEDGTVLIEVESTFADDRCHCRGRDINRFHGF